MLTALLTSLICTLMSRNRKTYIANYDTTILLPGGFIIPSCTINNNSRRCVLLSLIWTFHIINTTVGLPVRWQAPNNNVYSQLSIGNLAASNLLGSATRPNALPAPLNSGVLIFSDPGQYFFNNVFFQNEIYFDQEFNNFDAAQTFTIRPNLIIEIEEL